MRNFLRLAQTGVYDGTAFHRVVRGFVIQGGYLPSRREPLDTNQEKYVRSLPPEFNPTPHEKGILSMARGDDPASATTSFFIVTGAHAGARQPVHGVRPRRRGARRAGEDRGRAGERRGAGDARRGHAHQGCKAIGMLKGTRDAVLHRMQPISIHGQLSYDVHYKFTDEPDGQMRVARVGPEALVPGLQEGDTRHARFRGWRR